MTCGNCAKSGKVCDRQTKRCRASKRPRCSPGLTCFSSKRVCKVSTGYCVLKSGRLGKKIAEKVSRKNFGARNLRTLAGLNVEAMEREHQGKRNLYDAGFNVNALAREWERKQRELGYM